MQLMSLAMMVWKKVEAGTLPTEAPVKRWAAERGRGRRHHRRRAVPRRLHAPAHHRRDQPCVASTEPTVAGVDRAVATTAAEPGVRRDDVTDYDNRTEWRAGCPTTSADARRVTIGDNGC